MDEWFARNPFVGFAPWIIYGVVAGVHAKAHPSGIPNNLRSGAPTKF